VAPSNKQKLELTWIGKENRPKLEPRILLEDPAQSYHAAQRVTDNDIHVNMLKEGWDVTNLYTVVPLRAANARTLIEQSIGRGLRLPYQPVVKVGG
jgi:hypothetical protein